MHPHMQQFLDALLANCETYHHATYLTLSAIHSDGRHPVPSRHVPLDRPDVLHDALTRLDAANRAGWGAYVAIGLRRADLGRWKRGGQADVVALPALFVDVDDASQMALNRLQRFEPAPSCIVFTGGGFHAYWWLDTPLDDLTLGSRLLRGLALALGGDHLSVSQSMRVPGSINTKPGRNNARSRIIEQGDNRYPLSAFDRLPAHSMPKPKLPALASPPSRHVTFRQSGKQLNPDLIAAVTAWFIGQGYVQRGDWLCGPCLYSQRHQHDDAHISFGFNMRSAYGNCFVCGSMLLKDICAVIGLPPTDYGGLLMSGL